MPVKRQTRRQMAVRRPSKPVGHQTDGPGASSRVEQLLAALAVRTVLNRRKEHLR